MEVEALVKSLTKYVNDRLKVSKKALVKFDVQKEIYQIVNSFIGDIDGSQVEVGEGEFNVVILANKWIMCPHADLVCPRCKAPLSDLGEFVEQWFKAQVDNKGETKSLGKRCEKCKAMTRYSLKI